MSQCPLEAYVAPLSFTIVLHSRVKEMTKVFHGVTKISRLSGENLFAVLGSNHEPIVV